MTCHLPKLKKQFAKQRGSRILIEKGPPGPLQMPVIFFAKHGGAAFQTYILKLRTIEWPNVPSTNVYRPTGCYYWSNIISIFLFSKSQSFPPSKRFFLINGDCDGLVPMSVNLQNKMQCPMLGQCRVIRSLAAAVDASGRSIHNTDRSFSGRMHIDGSLTILIEIWIWFVF